MQIEIAGQKGRLWWKHQRREDLLETYPDIRSVTNANWLPFGGYPEDVVSGWAVCSELDKFNKETGRKISLSRLLQSMNLTKQQRKDVWNQYFDRRNNGG